MSKDKALSQAGFYLLLDSGNTRLKCRAIKRLRESLSLRNQSHMRNITTLSEKASRYFEQHNETEILAEVSIANHEAQDFAFLLKRFQADFGSLIAVYGVTVSGADLQKTWEEIVVHETQQTIQWMGVKAQELGLSNHYALSQIGKDRWYGVLGAYAYHQKSRQESRHVEGLNQGFLYSSFGTASTIDAVMAKDYLGGVIFPGVALMQSSLFQGTAQLPEIELSESMVRDFPKSTIEAIAAGITIAQVGAVMRQIQKFYQAYGLVPALYVTGGARKSILPAIRGAYDEWAKPLGLNPLVLIELDTPVLDGIYHTLIWNHLY